MLIAEKCANRSLPPSSGVMNPKPFASLNHFTVPLLMFTSSFRLSRANPDPGSGSRRSRKGIDCHCEAPHGARREVPKLHCLMILHQHCTALARLAEWEGRLTPPAAATPAP